ncbi:DegQ family serine endoprotease [Kaistia terrae]|uniref:DegQ family serine endoprotease n=1 Tax=Kaistia terrae TaxID=537017 RepID=A0ABW0Q028_9HYPH|nr:DegQ family serine endoprotease [Kaistia terrae]MCX5579081.1 DegQ family serine endoprotease [Kaistia terrae]
MRFGIAVAVGLAGALLGGPVLAAERTVPQSEAALRYSFSPIVKRVSPAVVNVYASRVVEQRTSPFMDDPFFRRFFGGETNNAPRKRVQQSLGSGVIVDPSGIVVTNYHVIANADEVKVALSDKRELEAEVVLKDERMDLAVLRLKGGDGQYPVVPYANSDALEVGDLVLAIGDPFGVGQTVTSGIVSALARTQIGASDYQFFVQTDAAINPGNSGGALVDMDGGLVGINTAIYSRSGGSIGIGFAIPSNMVRVVVQSALKDGKLMLPWLGAGLQQVTPEIAEGLGIGRPRGALVTDVAPAGPAEKAGLKSGDLVVSVDGVEVDDPNGLNYRLATKGVDGSVKLDYIRGGKTAATELALVAAPETIPRDLRTIDGASPFAGATVVNLSPAVVEELGYAGKRDKGVLVQSIEKGSAAAGVGFRAGDILVEANGVKIASTQQLADIAAQRASRYRLIIERGGRLIRSQVGR